MRRFLAPVLLLLTMAACSGETPAPPVLPAEAPAPPPTSTPASTPSAPASTPASTPSTEPSRTASVAGGNPSVSKSASGCDPLTTAQLEALSKGLKGGGRLTGGYVVPLPNNQQSGPYRQIAAPTIEGGDGDGADVLLAMGDDVEPVITVGAESKRYFTWGEAAADGSPERQYAESLLLSEAAAEVSLC